MGEEAQDDYGIVLKQLVVYQSVDQNWKKGETEWMRMWEPRRGMCGKRSVAASGEAQSPGECGRETAGRSHLGKSHVTPELIRGTKGRRDSS